MWTQQSRGRIAQIAKMTKRYPCDLTDEEWVRIAQLMPKPGRLGRPREVDFREVINAVRYLVRSGCGWRMLPVRQTLPWVKHLFADGAYDRLKPMDKASYLDFVVEIIRKGLQGPAPSMGPRAD